MSHSQENQNIRNSIETRACEVGEHIVSARGGGPSWLGCCFSGAHSVGRRHQRRRSNVAGYTRRWSSRSKLHANNLCGLLPNDDGRQWSRARRQMIRHSPNPPTRAGDSQYLFYCQLRDPVITLLCHPLTNSHLRPIRRPRSLAAELTVESRDRGYCRQLDYI